MLLLPVHTLPYDTRANFYPPVENAVFNRRAIVRRKFCKSFDVGKIDSTQICAQDSAIDNGTVFH
jgi:hypothetical protein